MIYSGNNRAKEMGIGRYRDLVMKLAAQAGNPWSGEITDEADKAIHARIDFSRWIGDCPCGGAAYVEPDDPIMFCPLCGNAFADGKAVRVIFPEPAEMAEIIAALEEREIVGGFGSGTQAMLTARPKYGAAARSWVPGESAADLRQQYAMAKPQPEVDDGI
jgi:hypothetical protein